MAEDLGALGALSDGIAALAGRAGGAVVGIEGEGVRASGFVWRPGWVVTADEALGEGGLDVVLPGGARAAAVLRGRDPSTDVALLKVEAADGPSVGPAEVAKLGALALALGRAEGDLLAGFGVVSRAGAAWRSMRGGRIDARVELALRLDRRGEGGPVFSGNGGWLGMAAFGPRRRALVIPAATVERVAAKLVEAGRVARGWLGAGLQPVAVAGGGAGVMVVSLAEGGPAAAAGLLQGDIVVSLDGAPLAGLRPLMLALGPESVGTVLRLGLVRAGAAAEAVVTVGERPE